MSDYYAETYARLKRENRRSRTVITAVVAVAIAAVAVLIWLAVNATDEHADACRATGGIVKSSSKSTTSFDTKGKPVFGSTTINVCINKEGNVTDVW
jgi:predicted metal-binding membrane protein